jgi:hypothetical protein
MARRTIEYEMLCEAIKSTPGTCAVYNPTGPLEEGRDRGMRVTILRIRDERLVLEWPSRGPPGCLARFTFENAQRKKAGMETKNRIS